MEPTSRSWNSRSGLEQDVPASLIPSLKAALKEFVHELMTGDFTNLVADGRAGWATVDDLRRLATEYYPYQIVELPDTAWQFADAVALDESSWHILIDMWTAEEGRSYLTLEVTATATPEGVKLEFENLHVL